MTSAKHRASALIVCLFVALMPFSSFSSAAAGEESGAGVSGCTVQERINWICRQGSDALISCSAEWKMPQYASELNELALLREEYGSDKLLKDLDYKGDDYCPMQQDGEGKPAAPVEKKCTIQNRINWICSQSKDDEAWSCTAEYSVPEYAEELNNLVSIREQYGGYAVLESVGYEGSKECGEGTEEEKPAQRNVKEEETEKGVKITGIDSDGGLIEVNVEDGLIVKCLRNGEDANCPKNSDIPRDAFDEVGDDEKVVPNGASISILGIGSNSDLLYTPYSTPSVEVSAFGEKGTSAALVLWLTDENGAKLVPLLVKEDKFGDYEGDMRVNEELSMFVDEGKYRLLAVLWQGGLKRDEKYLLSDGVETSIYVLENPEEIRDSAKPASDEVGEKLKAYLEARYSSSRSSEAYRKAFRDFMEAYVKSSFEDEGERSAALAALNDENMDALIADTETAFRKEIQKFHVEAGLSAANVAYDEVKAMYDSYYTPNFISNPLLDVVNLVAFPPEATQKKLRQLSEIRSAFAILNDRLSMGEDYTAVYDSVKKGSGAEGEDEELLHKAMFDYHTEGLFSAIRNNDAPAFHYETGKMFIHYAVYGFMDPEKVDFANLKEVGEEEFYSVSFGPWFAGGEVSQRARNLIRLGEDQFIIVKNAYTDSVQAKKIESVNPKLKEWGQKTGLAEVVSVLREASDVFATFIPAGMAASAAVKSAQMLSKIPSVVSRLAASGARTLLFAGAAFEGVKTIGGCIEFFASDAGKVSESGAEYSKCYARAASTIVLTVAPAKLSAKSLKPVIQSAEETNVFRTVAKSAAKTGRTRPAAPKVVARPAQGVGRIPNIKPAPAPKLSPAAAAERAALSASSSAEASGGSRHIGRQGLTQIVKKLETWMSSPKARASMGEGRKGAMGKINEAKANLRASPSAGMGGGAITNSGKGLISASFPRGKASGMVNDVGGGWHGEDSILISTDKGLMVVSDGVTTGGGGASSSSNVIAVLSKQYVPGTGSNGLARGIEQAHHTNPAGASTVVAASVESDTLSVAWVGDSRLYVVRKGQANLLTNDHAYSPHHLSAAIGGSLPSGGVPTRTLQLQKGDVVVISTDGLHDNIMGGNQLAQIVGKSTDPEKIRATLFSHANANKLKPDDIGFIVYVHQ